MEPRRFYLDTATRSFVASPDTTVPAPTNLFFREDVEAVELYFLKPTGNLAAPYEYRDYSANTVKLAIGLQPRRHCRPLGRRFLQQSPQALLRSPMAAAGRMRCSG